MADLTTIAGIEAELAATADYDVTYDVAKAKRRVAALRRKLDFPQATGRGNQGMSVQFFMEGLERQLKEALSFVKEFDTSREPDPSVVHADFSNFRGDYA